MYLFRGETSSIQLGYRTEGANRLILPVSEDSSEFFLYLKIGMFSLYMYSSLTEWNSRWNRVQRFFRHVHPTLTPSIVWWFYFDAWARVMVKNEWGIKKQGNWPAPLNATSVLRTSAGIDLNQKKRRWQWKLWTRSRKGMACVFHSVLLEMLILGRICFQTPMQNISHLSCNWQYTYFIFGHSTVV